MLSVVVVDVVGCCCWLLLFSAVFVVDVVICCCWLLLFLVVVVDVLVVVVDNSVVFSAQDRQRDDSHLDEVHDGDPTRVKPVPTALQYHFQEVTTCFS